MIQIADPQISAAARQRVNQVLMSGQLASGDEVEAFQSAFASFCGTDHAVATTNGTTALHAALHALGIGQGDRVVTTPFTFVASANAPRLCGADVGFVDIDPETYNIDPHALEAALRDGQRIDAVVAVHLYGLPADVAHLVELAETYDFALVEDAAQSHGAEFRGRRVGSFGDAACFSFYPTKNMTTGEGGMITTDRDDVATAAARFIDHGRVSGYEHETVGHNFRLTDIAAAIGREQLDRLPTFNERRRANARRLTEALSDTDVVTPTEPTGYRHVFHQYTVRADDRDALADHLERNGVGTGVYYPIPLHRQPAFADVGGTAPDADRAAAEVLSLPVHPGLDDEEVDRVADAVRGFLEVSA
jgi:dTDP-4-amino-4,6-dideoxygalactose transaminase